MHRGDTGAEQQSHVIRGWRLWKCKPTRKLTISGILSWLWKGTNRGRAHPNNLQLGMGVEWKMLIGVGKSPTECYEQEHYSPHATATQAQLQFMLKSSGFWNHSQDININLRGMCLLENWSPPIHFLRKQTVRSAGCKMQTEILDDEPKAGCGLAGGHGCIVDYRYRLGFVYHCRLFLGNC